MFLWKNYFSAVDYLLPNVSSRGLMPRAFNMSCNLVYAASILVEEQDLMGSAKMEEGF